MTVEAVVFDIGNVLIEWQPERYYDRRIGRQRREAFFGAFDFHGLMNEIDAGAPFSEIVAARAQAHPEHAAEIVMLRDEWLEMAGTVIDHSVRLMEALRAKGVPVYALSNFGAENFGWSAEAHSFLRSFDRAYISGEMGMRKPHAEIYAAVEADSKIAPERLLFGDDREENVAAAQARGWRAVRVDSAGHLAQALVSHGLLTEEEAL